MRQMTVASENTAAALLFAVISLLVGSDLLADAGTGAGAQHLAMEGAGTLLAAGGAAWFARRHVLARRDALHWRAQAEELLAGVGKTVQARFVEWGLTAAVAEVALLLLKGLSFKEVAAVRETGERTAREQARAV